MSAAGAANTNAAAAPKAGNNSYDLYSAIARPYSATATDFQERKG
jgi:hypothetical protein